MKCPDIPGPDSGFHVWLRVSTVRQSASFWLSLTTVKLPSGSWLVSPLLPVEFSMVKVSVRMLLLQDGGVYPMPKVLL